MPDPRTTPQTATAGRGRAQRSADALVARYILELSGRHGRPTHPSPRRTATDAGIGGDS
jgi:hypothetical protein